MTIPGFKTFKRITHFNKKNFVHFTKSSIWFIFGAIIGFFFFISFLYIYYRQSYSNYIYEGIRINNIDFGGKKPAEIQSYFYKKNQFIKNIQITLIEKDIIATVSAKQIDFGYDQDLLAHQAYIIGRSDNLLSNISLISIAYLQGVDLAPAYHYKEDKLNKIIKQLQEQIDSPPIDGQFNFENGKVTAFKLSTNGKSVDVAALKEKIIEKMTATNYNLIQTVEVQVPVKIIKPKIATEDINKMGIKERIGQGTSLFYHSIPNRIYNLTLASSKLNGILIAPGEIFSTVKAVGDISAVTGYKQAYVISGGKTVLGDGGGVCQVSTTLFRAALNAGLPIVERNPHAYRVGYYEEDSAPGIDAAIYYPSVDLKFKNDTGNYILIQTYVDQENMQLIFDLYGTSDNRQTVVNRPVILSQSAAPEPLYQDDPTLPKGEIKQIDFAAGGANVYFTRTVTKDGKQIISDKFVSNYRPWQAIFLRGTKE